jgi:hypothetical protein
MALEAVQHGPLGGDMGSGGAVIEQVQQFADGLVVLAALQADDPGADRRAHDGDVEGLPGPAGVADAVESGAGEHEGIEGPLIEAGNAAVDVAAHAVHGQVGAVLGELGAAPHR